MNKITKIGVTALCGSLATIASAQAGEMTATGSATMTYVSLGGDGGQTTGNPLGMASGLTFAGSGELDGGQTFTVTFGHSDKNTYDASSVVLTTNSLGTFNFSQAGGGNGIGGYDDNVPTAWEETSGTAVTVGADMAKGVGSSMNIEWTSPSFMGSNLQLAYAPQNDGVKVNDKAGSATNATKHEAWDAVLDINTAGDNYMPNIFVGYSHSKQDAGGGTGKEAETEDHEEGTAGIVWTLGPVKAGFQRTIEYPGNQTAAELQYYANTFFGVSFNVSDDLSISYGKAKYKKGFVDSNENPTREIEADSIQIAYTMGGASVKIAQTDVDNAQYVTGTANDYEGTTVALSLAF